MLVCRSVYSCFCCLHCVSLQPFPLRLGRLLWLFVLLFSLFWGCDLAQNLLGLASHDIQPPVLLRQQSFDDYFVFHFNEPIVSATFTNIEPKLPYDSIDFEGKVLTIRLSKKTIPGKPYLLRASVVDANDNVLNFLTRVYGQNINPAHMLINEFNPEGSKRSNSPEVVELYVTKGGNIGGLTFTYGSLEENKGSFVFPSMDVASGDFILLHTRWDENHKRDIRRLNESPETGKDAAKARLSSDNAWDFWLENLTGLSNTNGALALYQAPQQDAPLLDVVIYSTSVTSKRYRGWKTSYLLRQVERLQSGWQGALTPDSQNQFRPLVPEDAIRSKDSTGTRSISRLHNGGIPVDSNSAADWIIVPTRQYSFGKTNSLKRYTK